MPWEGYNYEDALIINERLIENNLLSSLNMIEYETVYSTFKKDKLLHKSVLFSNENSQNLNDFGIIKLGSYVKSNDILVGKISPLNLEYSETDKLFSLLLGTEKKYKDTSLRVLPNKEGRVIDIKIFRKETFSSENSQMGQIITIHIYIAHISKIDIGDKLAGRHGNKGIISKVLATKDMPILPDGNTVDIIFNPLGIPSRMNVGQIFECLLGFASEKMGKRFQIYPFDETYGNEASRILINQKLKEASILTKNN